MLPIRAAVLPKRGMVRDWWKKDAVRHHGAPMGSETAGQSTVDRFTSVIYRHLRMMMWTKRMTMMMWMTWAMACMGMRW